MSLYTFPAGANRSVASQRQKSFVWSTRCTAVLVLGLCVLVAPKAEAQWTQFGGSGQAFKSESTGLATTWPSDGPPVIWRRELGDGFSTILADEGRLYTLYRAGLGPTCRLGHVATPLVPQRFPYWIADGEDARG